MSIESFVAVLNRIAPWSVGQITHGDRQLSIAPDLDDSRFLAWLVPPPLTPLDVGIAETFRRFESLRTWGKLGPAGGLLLNVANARGGGPLAPAGPGRGDNLGPRGPTDQEGRP